MSGTEAAQKAYPSPLQGGSYITFAQLREGAHPKFTVKHFIFQRKKTSLLAVRSDKYEERNNGKHTGKRANVDKIAWRYWYFLIDLPSGRHHLSQLQRLAWSGAV